MPIAGGIFGHAAQLYNGAVFVTGGVTAWPASLEPIASLASDASNLLKSSGAVRYDLASGTWSTLPDMPAPNAFHASWIAGECILYSLSVNFRSMSNYLYWPG